jgi:hypothetical protein
MPITAEKSPDEDGGFPNFALVRRMFQGKGRGEAGGDPWNQSGPVRLRL